MRSLYVVIDEMFAVIPESEEYLRIQLKSIQYSASYAAPELQPYWWNQCGSTLNTAIPEITEDWHKKLAGVFSGKGSDIG